MNVPISSTDADLLALSFEEALAELEAIVRQLEGGQADLDASIAHYERGTQLKDHCLKQLADARLKVEKIMQKPSGEIVTEPLDAN